MCARKVIGAPSMIRWIRRGCGLGEDVADLRFELSFKSSAAEAEQQCIESRILINRTEEQERLC